MTKEETLRRISDFHGHLGPYVVLGYRMGLVANKLLGADPFGKTVSVLTGGRPPKSCLVDGIQLSSGCTLGKGLVGVVDQGEVAAIFMSKKDKSRFKISLKESIIDQISTIPHEEMESLASNLFEKADDELFDMDHGE